MSKILRHTTLLPIALFLLMMNHEFDTPNLSL
jgi:hypothetical protein